MSVAEVPELLGDPLAVGDFHVVGRHVMRIP